MKVAAIPKYAYHGIGSGCSTKILLATADPLEKTKPIDMKSGEVRPTPKLKMSRRSGTVNAELSSVDNGLARGSSPVKCRTSSSGHAVTNVFKLMRPATRVTTRLI